MHSRSAPVPATGKKEYRWRFTNLLARSISCRLPANISLGDRANGKFSAVGEQYRRKSNRKTEKMTEALRGVVHSTAS